MNEYKTIVGQVVNLPPTESRLFAGTGETSRRPIFNRRQVANLPYKTALALCIALAGCSSTPKAADTEPVVPVQVAEVTRDSIRRIVTAQAILFPVDQASVMPKISAPVKTFHVKRGDHVAKGQLLAVLENRDLAAAVG